MEKAVKLKTIDTSMRLLHKILTKQTRHFGNSNFHSMREKEEFHLIGEGPGINVRVDVKDLCHS